MKQPCQFLMSFMLGMQYCSFTLCSSHTATTILRTVPSKMTSPGAAPQHNKQNNKIKTLITKKNKIKNNHNSQFYTYKNKKKHRNMACIVCVFMSCYLLVLCHCYQQRKNLFVCPHKCHHVCLALSPHSHLLLSRFRGMCEVCVCACVFVIIWGTGGEEEEGRERGKRREGAGEERRGKKGGENRETQLPNPICVFNVWVVTMCSSYFYVCSTTYKKRTMSVS